VNEVTRICLRMFLEAEVVAADRGKMPWKPLIVRNLKTVYPVNTLVAAMPDDKQKTLRLAFRNGLKTMGKYVQEHLPLTNA